MTGNRSAVVVGSVLIVLGVLLGLRTLGVLPTVPVGALVLIGVGVGVIVLGVSRGDEVVEETLTVEQDGAASARLVLAYGAGTLRVAGGAADGQVAAGTFVGGVRHDIRRVGERLDVALRHPTDLERLLRARHPLNWDVALSDVVPLDLEVRSGAAEVRLDLTSTRVRSVEIKSGASNVELRLPEHGHVRVDVDAGAADVRVLVPQDVAASVRNRSALASVDIDERRFPRHDGRFRSPDFDDAADRAEIDIEGGVAAFTVR